MKITNYNSYANYLSSAQANSTDKNINTGRSFQDVLSINMNNDPEKDFLIKKPFNQFLLNGLRVLVDYEPSKLPPLKVENQQINFPIDLPFKLGEFGGRSVAMRVFSDGGMETSLNGGLLPPDPESERTGKVPDIVLYADRMASRFSETASNQGTKKSHMLFLLHRYGTGQLDPQEFKQDISKSGVDLKNQLVQLGIDISKEFKVNGTSFYFENGDLQVK